MQADLAPLIGTLRESAQFVRTHPDEAIVDVGQLCEHLHNLRWTLATTDEHASRMAERLGSNLAAGMRFVRSNPGMLAGYLIAAADEIEAYVDQQRKESGNADI